MSSARFDLTEHQLYTLSAGTKNVLKNLVEPITLRFYISKKLATGLPGIKG
ncbi:MAG: Gldg family protein, partial [Nitrospira sp.]|nr:Gldg family protein [Nitrospira sp.]